MTEAESHSWARYLRSALSLRFQHTRCQTDFWEALTNLRDQLSGLCHWFTDFMNVGDQLPEYPLQLPLLPEIG